MKYAFINRLINISFKSLITIFIARIIGAVDFGYYSIILTISSILTLVILFGSNNFILVRSSNSRFKKWHLELFKKYYFYLMLIISVGSFGVLFLVFTLSQAFIITLFLSINFYFFSIQYIFMANVEYKRLTIINFLFYLVFAAFLIFFSTNTFYHVLIYNAISDLLILLLFIKSIKPSTLKLSRKEMKILKYQLKFSSKSFINDLQNILLQRLDYLIIGLIANPAAFGIYAASKNVAEALLFIPKTIQPFLLQSQKGEKFKSLILYSILFLFASSLVIFLFSKELMLLLYGDKFNQQSYWLQLNIIIVFTYSLIMLINSKLVSLSNFRTIYFGNILYIVSFICIVTIYLIFNLLTPFTIGVISVCCMILTLITIFRRFKNNPVL